MIRASFLGGLLGVGAIGALAVCDLCGPAPKAAAAAPPHDGADAVSADALPHVCLESPISRAGPECSSRSPQKVGPCGVPERSPYVTELRPGETITVVFRETVNHPSHYRISFNPDGDDFPDPQAVDDVDGPHPYVLLDGVPDEDAPTQSVRVTLPDLECDDCTLQLIQVMYDKQGNGFGGRNADGGNDDIYYACADLVLRRR